MRWSLSTVAASHFRVRDAGKGRLLGLSGEAMIRRSLTLSALALLAACASAPNQYPSLAVRPAERASGTFQPVPAEPVLTPPTPATLDRVSQLAAEARAADRAFADVIAGARRTIIGGHGAAVGSEAWANAEAAFADVRAARSKTMVSLVDLDRLFVDAGTQGDSTDRIGAARAEVAALVSSEDQIVAELSANLP